MSSLERSRLGHSRSVEIRTRLGAGALPESITASAFFSSSAFHCAICVVWTSNLVASQEPPNMALGGITPKQRLAMAAQLYVSLA